VLHRSLLYIGHDVTLFASGDSHTRAQFDAAWPHWLRLDPSISDPLAPHLARLEHVRRRAHEFDILALRDQYRGCRFMMGIYTSDFGIVSVPEGGVGSISVNSGGFYGK
jgi:hypothetical protein